MCNDKIGHRCKKSFAVCVKYEGDIPEHSSLAQDDCLDIQQVSEDLYGITTQIKDDINLEDIESDCVAPPTEKNPKNYIQAILNKICELELRVESLETQVEEMEEQIEELQNNICP